MSSSFFCAAYFKKEKKTIQNNGIGHITTVVRVEAVKISNAGSILL